MIAHFRRYQRAIYLVITVVIIISFSFFGTYSAIRQEPKLEDTIIATLSDGTKVYQSIYTQFAEFLLEGQEKGDSEKINPLNSDFIEKNILNSPFGKQLIASFEEQLREEFVQKVAVEKLFSPYQHPSAPFINAKQIWSYFSPKMEKAFGDFQKSSESSTLEEIYEAKKNLYLAQREFPAFYLKQILSYQQKQYSWVDPDPALDVKNLNIFGYTTLEEWFGPRFIKAMLLSIMDIAAKAEREGFTVTYDEAKLSLYGNARAAVVAAMPKEGLNEIEIAQKTNDLINRTLVRYGIDEHKAVSIMKKCLLFEKSVRSIPSHIIPSEVPFKKFLDNSFMEATVVTYALPEWLRGDTIQEILQTQLWIEALSPKKKEADPLAIPTETIPYLDLLQKTPDLLQKQFLVSINTISKKDFFEKIRLKDIWKWINQDKNWNQITKKYPILLEQKANSAEDRLQIYEAMKGEIKRALDNYVRTEIISEHPEWIQEELQKQKRSEPEILALRPIEKPHPRLPGIEKSLQLLQLLESVEIGTISEKLQNYTQDETHFYQILLLDRLPEYQLVPLKTASRDGTLHHLLEERLQSEYKALQNRQEKSAIFQKENGEYRDFIEVQNAIIERVYSSYIKSIEAAARQWKEKLPGYFTLLNSFSKENQVDLTLLAKVRYLSFLDQCKEKIKASKENEVCQKEIEDEESEKENTPLSLKEEKASETLIKAFLLERKEEKKRRKELSEEQFSELHQLFMEKPGTITNLYYDQEKKTPLFSLLVDVPHLPVDGSVEKALFDTLRITASFLGEEAIAERSQKLIEEMKANKIVLL